MSEKLNIFTMLLVFLLFLFSIAHSLQHGSDYYKTSSFIDIEITLFILVLVSATLNAALAIICALKKRWHPFKVSLQWLSICLGTLILVMIIDAPTLLYSSS